MKQSEAIKSLSYDQDEIISNIIKLYCPEGIELDATYSRGNFYKHIAEPKYKFDIKPQVEDVVKADCRCLPLTNNSIKSAMFDPPFLNTKPVKETPDNDIIHKRFGFINGINNLWNFYHDSLNEFHRVLEPNGVLIFKCQDMVSSGKQYLNHVDIINYAYSSGFYPKDIFVLGANIRILSPKHVKQQHARKYHSYMLVFVKQESPVKYFCYHCKPIESFLYRPVYATFPSVEVFDGSE